MGTKLRLVALAACALGLYGCTNGEECDRCTTELDCKPGYVCAQFTDRKGNPVEGKRCGSGQGATQCRTLRR